MAMADALSDQGSLQHLHLDAAILSRQSFAAMANMLQQNRSIRKLDLLRLRRDEFAGRPIHSNQGMDDAIVMDFAQSLRHNTTLRELYASPMGAVTQVGFEAMETALQHHNHTLQQIVVIGFVLAQHKVMFRIQMLLELNKFGLRQPEGMSRDVFQNALMSCCSDISLECLFHLLSAIPSHDGFLHDATI